MNYAILDRRIEKGEKLRVTYRYPIEAEEQEETDLAYQTRTDRLLAVEPTNGRMFVCFRGEFPVWIEPHEVVAVEATN